MPNFTFNPEGHIYKVDGNQWPSVTSVLPYNYKGDNTYAMQKGTYIHDMCKLYLLNDLDEEYLDDVLKPYLQALKKFIVDFNLPIGYTDNNE